MKVYIYPWHDCYRAIRGDGKSLFEANAGGRTHQELLAHIQSTLTVYKDFAWVPNPEAHPLVNSLINPPEDDEPLTEAVELPINETLCQHCSHANVCTAANETINIGARISSCPEYTEKQDHGPEEDRQETPTV